METEFKNRFLDNDFRILKCFVHPDRRNSSVHKYDNSFINNSRETEISRSISNAKNSRYQLSRGHARAMAGPSYPNCNLAF